MNLLEGLKNPIPIRESIGKIHQFCSQLKSHPINLMEVCGTHTMSVYRHGIKHILPAKIHLLAGPGCPVCVTPTNFVDLSIELSGHPGIIMATFGDMMKVPGQRTTLAKEKAEGADIRVVYSPLDSLEMARQNPLKEIVFLGVGFETTIPTIAVTILEAKKENLRNFSVLCSHKVMPPPMKALVESKEIQIDGFICPGHVSTITGAKIFDFLARDYHIPCVISGFEPFDLLKSIEMLLAQILENRSAVEIQYDRCITREGNRKAQDIIQEIFESCDSEWRGMGIIPDSGLKIRPDYQDYDAMVKFDLTMPESMEIDGCLCGDVLRGVKSPVDCRLFRILCTPENPIGPCMVSHEGTCAAYFKYEKLFYGATVR